jgi:hypothetical protein
LPGEDFGELVFRQRLLHSGILLVRLAGLEPDAKAHLVAQIVIARYEPVEWEEGEPNHTARGKGGFGSSGR